MFFMKNIKKFDESPKLQKKENNINNGYRKRVFWRIWKWKKNAYKLEELNLLGPWTHLPPSPLKPSHPLLSPLKLVIEKKRKLEIIYIIKYNIIKLEKRRY